MNPLIMAVGVLAAASVWNFLFCLRLRKMVEELRAAMEVSDQLQRLRRPG